MESSAVVASQNLSGLPAALDVKRIHQFGAAAHLPPMVKLPRGVQTTDQTVECELCEGEAGSK